MIDQAVTELTPLVGMRHASAAVGEAQARWYRRHRQSAPPPKPERVPAPQPRAPNTSRCSGYMVLSESTWDHQQVNDRRVRLLCEDPATAPTSEGAGDC